MTVFTSSVLCSPTVDRDNCHAFHFERDTYIHTYIRMYVCIYIYILSGVWATVSFERNFVCWFSLLHLAFHAGVRRAGAQKIFLRSSNLAKLFPLCNLYVGSGMVCLALPWAGPPPAPRAKAEA